MATIKERKRADGQLSYRVVWKAGGGREGVWESETFGVRSHAVRFRRDVDDAGQHWPEGWVKGAGYQQETEAPEDPTFVDFGKDYVRDLTGITPATRHRYDRQVALVAEQLREVVRQPVTVGNLQDVHVRRWVNAREASGARPKTIANYHGLLYMIMSAAVQRGLRPGNPCAGTRLPDRYSPDAEGDGDVVFLTEKQFALIAEAMFPAAKVPAVLRMRSGRLPGDSVGLCAGTVEDRILLQVAVGTGLRWSELTALQLQDLELDGPVARLSVRRAWKRNPKGEFALPDEGAFYLGRPKSKKSRRRITLAPAVVQLLRRQPHLLDGGYAAPAGAPGLYCRRKGRGADPEVAVRSVQAAVAMASVLVLVAGCSSGGSGGGRDGRPDARTPGNAALPSTPSALVGDLTKAVISRTANFYGPNETQRTVHLDVYPAVRVDSGLLVPVDLTAEGGDKPEGSDYFCNDAVVCADFGAASLVDPRGLVRYGPLRNADAKGAVLSSKLPFELQPGTRYRAGVLFPVPDGAPTSVDLDLQYGGPVLGLPVVNGKPPEGLLTGGDAGMPTVAGGVITLPVQAAAGTPFVDRHPLVAKVVGGTVNQGGSAKQGVVSLAADVLFAFNSSTLTGPAQKVVQRAAQILTDKADPTKPVTVTGYTDVKGTDAYNASLSQRRAVAVADALGKESKGSGLSLRPTGRGAADPVAPNARPDGVDDPTGRALNRRVELAYTPKAAPPAPPAPQAAAPQSGNGQPLATLPAANVIASGAGAVAMTASVRSVRRDGALTVVEVGVTPAGPAGGVDYFSRGRNDRDLGSWRLVAAATSATYVPAADVDEPKRLLGTTVKQMNGGRDYLLTFWTAALPADLSSVDVVLGQLGRAKDVPVTR